MDRLGTRIVAALPRIGSGGVVLLCFAFFLRPEPSWQPSWEALAALVPALFGWIWLEIGAPLNESPVVPVVETAPREPHPHDVALLDRFNQLIDLRDRTFLREHTFSVNTDYDYIKGIEAFAEGWQGADYRFHDESVQTAFVALRAKAVELNTLFGDHLAYDERSSGVLTLLHRDESGRKRWTNELQEVCRAMDRALAEFFSALDHFWTIARERIGASSL